MNHIVLLGDSIFDNAAYVKDGLDVIAHLHQQIPPDWKASLRAVRHGGLLRVQLCLRCNVRHRGKWSLLMRFVDS